MVQFQFSEPKINQMNCRQETLDLGDISFLRYNDEIDSNFVASTGFQQKSHLSSQIVTQHLFPSEHYAGVLIEEDSHFAVVLKPIQYMNIYVYIVNTAYVFYDISFICLFCDRGSLKLNAYCLKEHPLNCYYRILQKKQSNQFCGSCEVLQPESDLLWIRRRVIELHIHRMAWVERD